MRYGFTEEQDRFRGEVRRTLRSAEVQAAVREATSTGGVEKDQRPLYRLLGDLGLLAVHWPVEFGGAGRPLTDAAIVAEELVRAGVPDTLHVNTIQIVGQFLLMAGTDEQKRRHLPALARGERFASVLYTEPDAGSDLGALRTVAEPDGDGYRVTGTKVFSLKTRFVDLGLCAARTTPDAGKYQGISLFLVDLSVPGVTVTTIPGIGDEHFHQVDLDAVPVSGADLLGPRDQGWPLLNEALAIERTGLDYHLKAERWFEAALEAVTDPAVHLERIGRWEGALTADHVLAWEVLTGLAADRVDPVAAAVAKLHSSELAQDIAMWAYHLPHPEGRAAILDSAYREAPGLTLSAGTSEVMLQIMAAAFDSIGSESSDPLVARLRAALRAGLAHVPVSSEVHGPVDGSQARSVLDELGAYDYERSDGFDLGVTAGVVVNVELGRAACGNPYRADALAADVGHPGGVALAGFEAMPGVTATPSAGGWELTGTALADGPGPFLVATQVDGEPTLVAASGPSVENGCVRFDRTPATVVARLDEPLARARLRQAAYLLGIAEGAHDIAVRYAGVRRQFGTRLRDLPAVAFPLARAMVALRATGAAVYRGAWLADSGRDKTGTAPITALAMAAETARDVVRICMQACGVRAMTAELGLHRHFRLAAAESGRFGEPAALWRLAGSRRLDQPASVRQ
ncbi:acyl-CoA dehydrogenase family protein [Herbidospora sp. RD11066]